MAISGRDLDLLIHMRQAGYIPTDASVCEIGAQQLSKNFLLSAPSLETARTLFGVSRPWPFPAPPVATGPAAVLDTLDADAPFAREFWTWLGFDYASIDIDGSPGSIPLDLNYDDVPRRLRGKFRIVTNFGTTEHVANQFNAFKIIHELTAVNGIMMHTLPAQGMFNHGLVNYNPKFFWMLSRSNGYKWLHMNFVPGRAPAKLPDNIVNHMSQFVPNAVDRMKEYRGADCGMYIILQKIFDIAYVAPLDVNTGTRTDHEVMKKRYWTVFEPNAFEKLAEESKSPPGWAARVKRKLLGR